MEQHIMSRNPELGGALVVIDTQRPGTALLIEPAAPSPTDTRPQTTAGQASLIEKIWPSIEEANTTTAPPHERIDKALILVTTPDRPLIRDSNGAIQRAASAEQYAAELDALYAHAEFGPGGDGGGGGGEPVSSDRDSIAQFVQESVSAVTSWPHEDANHEPGGTFFERGMDSTVALQLARVLRRGLRRSDVGLSTVYCNPTVSQLTSAVLAVIGK
ncbi:hypothetical protein F5883DRAFT_238286 [Diaporthe sp. PMI_573]|nr:hypothetical protein F5883DRAFT_238286 [Diaporthaceae sp. PMI_573]